MAGELRVKRLLLDTHVLVWWLADTERLKASVRRVIADPTNMAYVSAITGWEIAVNRAKGRMVAPDHLQALIVDRGFTHLPLTYEHAEQAAQLPGHHRDPFDRFLIAQAQSENLTIVTRDQQIPLYAVDTLAA